MRPRTEELFLDGPTGRLEAIVETPPEPHGVAVLCHPHPLYHGTMTNKVVHTLARVFTELRMAAVRFNFRGVGRSEGSYGEAVGETDDTLAVVEWASTRFGGGNLWLGGFSFGGYVALRAASRCNPVGLVTVAPAVTRFDPADLDLPDVPLIVLHGEEDEIVDVDAVIAWVNTLDPGPEFLLLEGAGHFFHGRLIEARETLIGAVRPHLPDERG